MLKIRRANPRATTLILLILVFALEFVLFDRLGARRHTWVYPRWNDQIQYLTEAYTGYEYTRQAGLLPGLWAALVNPSAQGTLHDFAAVAVFAVAGPSRSAALSLNLFALILWQATAFGATRRMLKSTALAWLVVFAALAVASPWGDSVGSAFDFRLDWMTACWFGATLAAAHTSDGFRSRRWSLAFGAAGAVTVLVRFLTGTYFVPIYLVFAIWILRGPERARRFKNLSLAAGVAALIAGPVLWLNRNWVYNYYWIGHFIGPESALRSSGMGVLASAKWIAQECWRYQIGPTLVVGSLLIALLLWRGRRWDDPTPEEPVQSPVRASWLVPSCAFFIVPFVILTLHHVKSNVVLNILLPGSLALIVAGWSAAASATSARVQRALALAVAGLSLGVFAARMYTPAYTPEFAASARKVNQLADLIFARSQSAHLTNPRVAVDRVTDCLDAQILRVITYERHHQWVPFVMTLPTGIFAEKDALIQERLANSDFVFLTDDGPPGTYPFDLQMESRRAVSHDWCDQNLKTIERFPLFQFHFTFYQRPSSP